MAIILDETETRELQSEMETIAQELTGNAERLAEIIQTLGDWHADKHIARPLQDIVFDAVTYIKLESEELNAQLVTRQAKADGVSFHESYRDARRRYARIERMSPDL